MSAKQGTPEWLMERCGIPTASRFGDIMAKVKTGESASRRNYRFELVVERLTGVPTEQFLSRPMLIGQEREPFGRIEYEVTRGVMVRECGLIRHATIECGASPDGLIEDDGGFEVKCPTPPTHFDYLSLPAGKCPPEYYWQIMGGLWLTDRKWWDFASFCPDYPAGLRLIVRRIKRDDEAIKVLETEVVKFIGEVRAAEKFARDYNEPKEV